MRPSNEMLEQLSFVGSVLSPFYLEDPRTGHAADHFASFSALEVKEASRDWPFADDARAEGCLRQMVDALAKSSDVCGTAFCADDALVDEYRRLFIGPGIKPAPPWGSVYTDREQVIFGESTLALRSWMKRNGIVRLAEDGMPDDHIGLMLSLMGYLAIQRPELLDEYLAQHFLSWAPHYLNELALAARHPFYEHLAHLTNATLDGIREALGIRVAKLRFYR